MKKNSNISFIKFIFIIYVIILLFLSLSYILLLMKKSDSNSYEIENYGQKYGNTQFIKYDKQISIPVPSGGRYFLEKVDVDSFRVLDSQDYSDRSTLIVGLDKNSVYFGNIRIPDLDPNKLKIIGNGYYTDGTNTYFCSDMSERNKNLSSPMEIFQTLIYAFSKTKRPQSYIYPYKKVETDKRLKAVDNLLFFASDGEKVYYKGEVLENVDLNTLVPIDGQYTYFTDNENIYYFQNYEIWKKYKNRGSFLASRNTEVYSLGKKESWKKLADTGNENIGSLWQKDNEYYYFDNLENSSSTRDYRSTIYKITDKSTLENLLSYPEYINAEKIDEFILNKNFEEFKGEKLFTATIKFHNVLKIFLGVLLVLGFIFIVFFLYLNKLNKEDKKNIDKMLLEKYRNIKPLSKDYNNKE